MQQATCSTCLPMISETPTILSQVLCSRGCCRTSAQFMASVMSESFGYAVGPIVILCVQLMRGNTVFLLGALGTSSNKCHSICCRPRMSASRSSELPLGTLWKQDRCTKQNLTGPPHLASRCWRPAVLVVQCTPIVHAVLYNQICALVLKTHAWHVSRICSWF